VYWPGPGAIYFSAINHGDVVQKGALSEFGFMFLTSFSARV